MYFLIIGTAAISNTFLENSESKLFTPLSQRITLGFPFDKTYSAANKNSFIVIDSDKRDADDDINDTKKRILDEFGDKCWITKGREIENYLNSQGLEQKIKDRKRGR